MRSISEIETCIDELTKDLWRLVAFCKSTQDPVPPSKHEARESVLANLAKLQAWLDIPEDFIQRLAVQTQILACLEWLGEFHVLACIPLIGSVPISDLAELANVPEAQLRRVAGMTSTVGFLQEQQPGHIAHTALSAPFVTGLSHIDAAMFLARTAAPAALQMATATNRFGHSNNPEESAYTLATNLPLRFTTACDSSRILQRQWPAYFRYGAGNTDGAPVVDILMSLGRLDALRVSNPCIVEIGAQSIGATSLMALYPTLNYIVQTDCAESMLPSAATPSATASQQQLDPFITVQQRVSSLPQPVKNATIYILRLGLSLWSSLSDRILVELRSHMDVLRHLPSSSLVLILRLRPGLGAENTHRNTLTRLSDLTFHQLANEHLLELCEVSDLIVRACDRLVIFNTVSLHSTGETALELRYQARGVV
ncbi:O-methyltransferase family protein [Nemania sp. NC0429]|nr:O-methyltransferase family protein [Nemania sp. NC0429]